MITTAIYSKLTQNIHSTLGLWFKLLQSIMWYYNTSVSNSLALTWHVELQFAADVEACVRSTRTKGKDKQVTDQLKYTRK